MQPTSLGAQGDAHAFDKPAGWLVHSVGTDAPDLQTWMATQSLPALSPVHRLDLGTSGVVLFAEDPTPYGAWFEAGEVDKTYLALVFGRTRKSGTIRRDLTVHGKTQSAETHFRAIENLGGFTLVELHPKTGRKHQIRRHLQGVNHAVVGDTRYRPRKFRSVPGFKGLNRLWLHASRLALPDGREWTSPLPPELEAHLALLRG